MENIPKSDRFKSLNLWQPCVTISINYFEICHVSQTLSAGI